MGQDPDHPNYLSYVHLCPPAQTSTSHYTERFLIHIYIYGQAPGIPPPNSMVWQAKKRLACARGVGAVGGGWGGQGSQRGLVSYARPAQAINVVTWHMLLFFLYLNRYFKPYTQPETPPKCRL